MEPSAVAGKPERIADLIDLKYAGAALTLAPSFEIVPALFTQSDVEYRAYIFLCRYSGTADGEDFSFRKCYARGCPHNLCPHVARAVMIANRHLKRDYHVLERSGIRLPEKFFSLDDMITKFDGIEKEHAYPSGRMLTLDDYIRAAAGGDAVDIGIRLEMLPAVEHFANYRNEQTFLMGNFSITRYGKTHTVQQCFACYETQKAVPGKAVAAATANKRLELIFHEFEAASVQYEKRFFH